MYSEDLQFLYEKITSVPLQSIDGQILQLAKSYTRLNPYYKPVHQKSKSTTEKHDYKEPIRVNESFLPGQPIALPTADMINQEENNFDYNQILYFLWNLWQEPAIDAGISKDICIQAITILKDSLLNYFRSERSKFLIKCLENIKNSSLVLWSCEIMHSILESYPCVKVHFNGMDSKSSIIKDLDRNHSLISDLYKSLIIFKQNAIAKALELSGEESTSSSDEEHTSETRKKQHEDLFRQIKVCKEGSLNYVEEVKNRLDFIKYIYSNSNESIKNSHIEVLWNCFILNASSESEYENLFN